MAPPQPDIHGMSMIRMRAHRVGVALVAAAISLGVAGYFGWRHVAYTAPPSGSIGAIDAPAAEAVVSDSVHFSGWALATEGIRAVEVRFDGQPHAAHYGIVRPDVAAAKPGYPDSAAAGFEFEGDFAPLSLFRHELKVVAIDRAGRETTIGLKSLIPPQALALWQPLLERNPPLATQPFRFIMMTSGIAFGGARTIESAYAPYLSRTQGVGVAVPILYLRSTKGASGDWVFDPDFDLDHKCRNRRVAEDSLNGVIRYAIERHLPVQFIVNGGIWADASCDTPEWDVNDYLEQDVYNCQWTQDNVIYPDDYLKNRVGSTDSPELARTLTYNVYATRVRAYKRRNLMAAASIIAEFARAHPDLFVGINLDSDTYMNPFFMNKELFDFNPGMLKQFRHWLAGSGPYAGKPEPGVPDLSSYRREHPLTLAEVNKIARKHWQSWDSVDPPRKFPDSPIQPAIPGAKFVWEDPWYQEWQTFRQHVIGLHYDELSEWAHEAGIPKDRIYSAQGFLAPEPGQKGFAVRIMSRGQNYDTSGVSIEGSIPRMGHLGAVIYGEAARNEATMEVPHGLFATFARLDSHWSVAEMNATDLRTPLIQPTYAQSYHSFRDLFNYDAQQVSVMAWNGSNGLYADQPGYLAYTAWRNTPAESAMRDFMVSHADLPLGARLWSFGKPGYADDDGWRLEGGSVTAQGGYLDVAVDAGTTTLLSPPDQVIRTATIDSLVLGLRDPTLLLALQVFARVDAGSPWRAIGAPIPSTQFRQTAAGLMVPLAWPAAWRAREAIVTDLKIVLAFDRAAKRARFDRIALYPSGLGSAGLQPQRR